jgi:hypothetical protein
MDEKSKSRQSLHDEEILSAYKRQVGLQIYLPIGLFSAALIALVSLLWVNSVGDFRVWADTALILVLLPTLILGLILLAILIALAVLIGKLIGIIPEPAYRIRTYIQMAEKQIKRGADLVLQPVVTLSALGSAIKEILKEMASYLGIE